MRYAQERNAYADESEGQAALIIAWQCVVEVTFTRRCGSGTLVLSWQQLAIRDALASSTPAVRAA